MSIFPPDIILEEEIFTPRNLGPDCDIIGGLLERFGEKFILSALEDGEYAIAVDHYLQLLDSLTAHFIADEHWCWFDDFYSPDYTVSHIWDAFIPHIRSGVLAGEPLAELKSGLKQIDSRMLLLTIVMAATRSFLEPVLVVMPGCQVGRTCWIRWF